MSSRLSDRVAQAMEANTEAGRCDMDAAAKALIETFDEDDVARALGEMATRLINGACRRAMAEIGGASARQGELPFRLHRAYALNIDGRRVVNTYDLTRVEANLALKIRDEQIDADTKSRNDLARAIKAADPHWDAQPDLSFGQALERAARASRAA